MQEAEREGQQAEGSRSQTTEYGTTDNQETERKGQERKLSAVSFQLVRTEACGMRIEDRE